MIDIKTNLKNGVGYDCAGQNRLFSRPTRIVAILILSAMLTFGATLPTGSKKFQRNKTVKFYST